MATATTKALTFNVTCPFCHEEDSTVTIDLNDLSDCRCTNCDETFTARAAVDHLVKQAERWEKVAAWIESAGSFLAE